MVDWWQTHANTTCLLWKFHSFWIWFATTFQAIGLHLLDHGPHRAEQAARCFVFVINFDCIKAITHENLFGFSDNCFRFSYGVLANIGSGAVLGRLPDHGFWGKFRGSVPGQGSGQVLGQVPEEGSGKVPGAGSGQVPRQCFRHRARERIENDLVADGEH